MQRDPAQVFRWPVRVYYEDTDFGGVVYYANYLRFFERARTEIDFLRGAQLDDELQITVELAERKRTYLMLKQQALRGEEPMAVALVQAACIDCKSFKPAPIPASLAERLSV